MKSFGSVTPSTELVFDKHRVECACQKLGVDKSESDRQLNREKEKRSSDLSQTSMAFTWRWRSDQTIESAAIADREARR
jgi:hypothetical protein